MDIDAPGPKFVLDEFIAAALSGTPAELHPFFESFRTLYTRKCVALPLACMRSDDMQIMAPAHSKAIRISRHTRIGAIPCRRLYPIRARL